MIDTQSAKTSTIPSLTSRGTDAAKRTADREHGVLTDTIGLVLTITVTAVGPWENALGIRLPDQAEEIRSTISESWGDTGSEDAVVKHGTGLDTDVEAAVRNSQVSHRQGPQRDVPSHAAAPLARHAAAATMDVHRASVRCELCGHDPP
ncbi:hypothetical protein IQ279_20090 [Streptomyces verrucosisporus]|nr:hypothetical protein [Streptomyces verrucosisporus]